MYLASIVWNNPITRIKKSEQIPFILLVFECNFLPNKCICFGW